jgi:hypothetical protein
MVSWEAAPCSLAGTDRFHRYENLKSHSLERFAAVKTSNLAYDYTGQNRGMKELYTNTN